MGLGDIGASRLTASTTSSNPDTAYNENLNISTMKKNETTFRANNNVFINQNSEHRFTGLYPDFCHVSFSHYQYCSIKKTPNFFEYLFQLWYFQHKGIYTKHDFDVGEYPELRYELFLKKQAQR